MVRQGNINKNVHLYRYVTKGTFDAYSYQLLEAKQRFISQIITSKTPARTCEDVDQQALSYSEIKALCTGDERIKELMVLENEVKELKSIQAEFQNTQYDMQDKLRIYPEKKQQLETQIAAIQTDIEHCQNPTEFQITIQDTVYTDRTDAGKALEHACLKLLGETEKPINIGSLQGFPIAVQYSKASGCLQATLQGTAQYHVNFTASFPHNLKKLEQAIYTLPEQKNQLENNLNRLTIDAQDAEKLLSEPFTRGDELAEKTERLTNLRTELNDEAAKAAKGSRKQRTFYFDMAKLRKSAQQVPKEASKQKQKGKINPEVG